MSVPTVLPEMAETLDPLHKLGRGYFEGDNNNQ
jgi:hypothetical protein